ncbi:MAG TPA: hypothetical protein VJS38_00580 [Phenylobacterium sp.]|uniref:hypothetical protein n=1 Tax=Phenylobacterium sp. TaxID=1871053 RepID=UPI002B46296D|nr:hypothetical protein [Phenylobacterium sp.]HKR86647.1 hypothetical protein [Phenylobacterium sp.]
MSARRLSILLGFAVVSLAAAGLATSAHAQYSRPAQRVLARAFAATGGQGWYMLRGWRETGRREGLAYEAWIDPLRYGLRTETRDAQGLRVHGFNGQADWQVGADGAITAVNDHATLSRARTEAFFAANCYFFRGRFDARGDYAGVRSLGGRSFEVVRIQPWGGEARELWFDQKNGLLARIVDRTGPRASAVRVSDYRKVGPVLIPFRLATEAGGRGSAPWSPDPLARERETLVFAPVPRERFSLNRPEELAKVEASRGRTAAGEAARRPAATLRSPAPP